MNIVDLIVIDFIIPDFLIWVDLFEIDLKDNNAEPVGNPPGHELFVSDLLSEGMRGDDSLDKNLFPEGELEEKID